MAKRANGGGGGAGSVSVRDYPQALLSSSLTTTVTGTFVDVTGALVTSGQVRFELKPSVATVIQNQNVVEPSVVYGSISSTGQLLNQAGTGPCVVVQNTVLEPGGTYYEVSIWPEFIKVAVFNWYATQATQDLSATIPLPPVLPFVPANVAGVIRVLVVTPTGTQPPGISGSAPGPYTYTPSNGTTKLYVECVGAGGGGGSSNATSSNASAAGGGGGGAYAASFLSTIVASYNVTIGAAGAGGSGGAGGGGGGNTLFGSGITANGGLGGGGGTTAGTVAAVSGGGVGGSGSIADYIVNGCAGSNGVVVSGTLACAGAGGLSPVLQSAPVAGAIWVTGTASAGGRAAGSGSCTVGTQSAEGGVAGAAGLVRIWEFA